MPSAQQAVSLVQRLVESPHDASVLEAIHSELAEAPEHYAQVLESAAMECGDPGASSHYLTEAGRTYLETVLDVPEGCRLLARAVEIDPLNARAADLLASAVAMELHGADYGGLLRRRALVLEHLAAEDPNLVVKAAEAWERFAENLVRTGHESDAAVAAMRRAFDLMRNAVHDTMPPPPSGDRDTLEIVPGREHRGFAPVDTIRARSPLSALLPAVGLDQELLDSEPTRPRVDDEDFRVGDESPHSTLRSPPPACDPEPAPSAADSPDRLIALFEALREVDRAPTVEQAGWQLIEVARRATRARAAYLHAFDEGSGDFNLLAVSGACDRSVLGESSAPTDHVLARAIAAPASVSTPAEDLALAGVPRFRTSPPKTAILCAAATHDERVVGAVELIDPLGRGEFDAADGHVLTYVSERWAEILAEHGRA
jgi:hypothetical protein